MSDITPEGNYIGRLNYIFLSAVNCVYLGGSETVVFWQILHDWIYALEILHDEIEALENLKNPEEKPEEKPEENPKNKPEDLRRGKDEEMKSMVEGMGIYNTYLMKKSVRQSIERMKNESKMGHLIKRLMDAGLMNPDGSENF